MTPNKTIWFPILFFSFVKLDDDVPLSWSIEFDKHDPLRALPTKAQMSIVVQAMRSAGWVEKDWELENRRRRSPLREFDVYHLLFWSALYVGRISFGGSPFW